MKILTTAIIKGGTGKTTTAAALAQAGAYTGARVLAVDLDPQANLSLILGADPTRPGIIDALHGTPAADLVQRTQGMDVLTACPDLAAEETRAGSANRLKKALTGLLVDSDGYDLIIIDTPPQMNDLTFNALQAATGLIIPLEADTNSLQGFYQIIDMAGHIAQSNPNLEVLGAVITRFDGRTKINRFLLEQIKERAKENNTPILGVIRAGVAIRETQTLSQSLYQYAPQSKPAQDYLDLYEKLMN